MSALKKLTDYMARETFGMTPDEARAGSKCISCKLLVEPEKFRTEADRLEYKKTALCPTCFERLGQGGGEE